MSRASISKLPLLAGVAALLLPLVVLATPAVVGRYDFTTTLYGFMALLAFVMAYGVVVCEETLHLRKSKPAMVAAGVIWILVATAYASVGDTHTPGELFRADLVEFAELMLFLIAAMTYINTMQERHLFDALRGWLVSRGFGLRSLFWITGSLAFLISPVADNLTTALLMAAVVTAVAGDNDRFVSLACINIVVAANAGGAFSPFGDITTLMVWQAGRVEFHEFFALVLPAAVNWLVPAVLMSMAVPEGEPRRLEHNVRIKQGGLVIVMLFVLTIALAVSVYNFLHLPPMLGMMTGLGVLKLYGYRIRRSELHQVAMGIEATNHAPFLSPDCRPRHRPFDIFISMKRVEWDTLMFFYGIIMAVGGLGALGYLAYASHHLYTDLGPTLANVSVGLLSAVIDNIPIMFAVLSMSPDMNHGQWLLVTLTAGVGGSMLSIGSAAGVALMGQARGQYTFFRHLRWTPAIALGYAGSIWTHMWVSAQYF